VYEVPVSGDDRDIELAADRCDQGVGPVQVGSGPISSAMRPAVPTDRSCSNSVVAEPLDVDVDRQRVEVVAPAGEYDSSTRASSPEDLSVRHTSHTV
jgi:hypothetical protein